MIEFILSAPLVLSALFILFVSIAILLEFEKNGWATTLFSIGLALILWTYRTDIWGLVSTNPGQVIYFMLGYIAAGLVWSLFKWKFYISKKVNEFEAKKNKFIFEVGPIKENWKRWTDGLKYSAYDTSYSISDRSTPEEIAKRIIPTARDKKALIVSWISYWPMSVGATLLNNPFRRFFEWIYDMVSGIYDKIGNSAVNQIASGFEKGEVEEENSSKKSQRKQLNS